MFSSFCSFRWYINHSYYHSSEDKDFFPLVAFKIFFFGFLAGKSKMGLNTALFVFFSWLEFRDSLIYIMVSFSVLENSWSVSLRLSFCISPPFFPLSTAKFPQLIFSSLQLLYSAVSNLLVNPTTKFLILVIF